MEIEITGSNVKEHNLFSCPDCIVVKACKVINYIQHELTNMKCTYCTKEDLHWPLRRQIFHHTLSEGPWLCLGPSELRHTTHHSCSWGQHLLSSKRKKNNYWWLKIKSEQQIIHGHSVVTVLLKKNYCLVLFCTSQAYHLKRWDFCLLSWKSILPLEKQWLKQLVWNKLRGQSHIFGGKTTCLSCKRWSFCPGCNSLQTNSLKPYLVQLDFF